jgi:hypothetical protein
MVVENQKDLVARPRRRAPPAGDSEGAIRPSVGLFARYAALGRRTSGRLTSWASSHSRLDPSLNRLERRHAQANLSSPLGAHRRDESVHDPMDGEEPLQGGGTGEAAAVRDLRGAGAGAAGEARSVRGDRGLALRAPSLTGVPASAGGSGLRGIADGGLARGGVLHARSLARARRAPGADPRARPPRRRRPAAARLLLLAGPAAGGGGAVGGRGRRGRGDHPPPRARALGHRAAALAPHHVPLVPRGQVARRRRQRRRPDAAVRPAPGPRAGAPVRCGTWGRLGGAPRAPACRRC